MADIIWLTEPLPHTYEAAESYLTLITPKAAHTVLRLRQFAGTFGFKAKDILRAAGLAVLPEHNDGVTIKRTAIDSGEALSPVLLARDDRNGRLHIVDGYHRVCTLYTKHESTVVQCRIVSLVY